MKHVRFRGPMGLPAKTSRVLPEASLKSLGLDVPDSLLENGSLVFGPHNNHTIEMSNEASDSLVAALPEQFEVVNEDEANQQLSMPMTVTTSQKESRTVNHDENNADDDSFDDE